MDKLYNINMFTEIKSYNTYHYIDVEDIKMIELIDQESNLLINIETNYNLDLAVEMCNRILENLINSASKYINIEEGLDIYKKCIFDKRGYYAIITIIKDTRPNKNINLYERLFNNPSSNLKTIIKYIKDKTHRDYIYIKQMNNNRIAIIYYLR